MLYSMLLDAVPDIKLDTLNITSVTGIIAATFMIVEILKRFIQDQTGILGKIPVWTYSVVVSAFLAFLANRVLHRDPSHFFLEGNLWIVMWKSVLGAASASGFFTWFRNPTGSMADAQPLGSPVKGEDHTMKPSILLLPLMLGIIFASGCQTTAPTSKVQVAQMAQAYSGVVNELVQLRSDGVIKAGSTADTTIKSADNRAYNFLQSARKSAEAGVSVPQTVIDGFNAAITDIQAGKADANHDRINTTQKGQLGIEAIAMLALTAFTTWQKMKAEGRATTDAEEEAELKSAFEDADAAHQAEQNE